MVSMIGTSPDIALSQNPVKYITGPDIIINATVSRIAPPKRAHLLARISAPGVSRADAGGE
jgi:hypothetical protein